MSETIETKSEKLKAELNRRHIEVEKPNEKDHSKLVISYGDVEVGEVEITPEDLDTPISDMADEIEDSVDEHLESFDEMIEQGVKEERIRSRSEFLRNKGQERNGR